MIPAAQSHDHTLPLYDLILQSVFSLPSFFFLSSSACLHLNARAQFHLIQHDDKRQVLCLRPSEKLLAEELLPELWEKCVCVAHQDE